MTKPIGVRWLDDRCTLDIREAALPSHEPETYEDITQGVLWGLSMLVDPEENPAWFYVHRALIAPHSPHGIDELLLVTTPSVIIFAKAYIETLAKHAGDQTADLLSLITFRRKHRTREIRVEIGDSSAAIVAIAEDLPDEARLALLDLDVTSEVLRGKLLRWDAATGAWRPPEMLDPGSGDPSHRERP